MSYSTNPADWFNVLLFSRAKWREDIHCRIAHQMMVSGATKAREKILRRRAYGRSPFPGMLGWIAIQVQAKMVVKQLQTISTVVLSLYDEVGARSLVEETEPSFSEFDN